MRVAIAFCLGLAGICSAVMFNHVDAAQKEAQKIRAATLHIVKMTAGNKFDPDNLDIKVGEQVKFVNPDGPSHTATSDDIKTGDPKKTFNTGTVKKGQDATITFNQEMTYSYHCEFHGPMTGKINVKP